jgi:hypothetical protein
MKNTPFSSIITLYKKTCALRKLASGQICSVASSCCHQRCYCYTYFIEIRGLLQRFPDWVPCCVSRSSRRKFRWQQHLPACFHKQFDHLVGCNFVPSLNVCAVPASPRIPKRRLNRVLVGNGEGGILSTARLDAAQTGRQ